MLLLLLPSPRSSLLLIFFPLICVILMSFPSYVDALYQPFNCIGYGTWPVDLSQSVDDANDMQRWLYLYQYDNDRCKKGLVTRYSESGGIGFSFVVSLSDAFWLSIETGKIFRPRNGYLWADTNASRCSLGLQEVDCYASPMSVCTMPQYEYMMIDNVDYSETRIGQHLNQTMPHGAFPDVCRFAKFYQKPIIWAVGQFFNYIMRWTPDVASFIESRKHKVFSKRKPGQLVVAVHVRAGTPDRGRQVFPYSHYQEILDSKAQQLKASRNQTISTVFVASQDPEHTFGSVANLTATYPRPYEFVLLPYTPQYGDKEVERSVQAGLFKKDNMAIRKLALEYFADVEIMVEADVFIGSWSNMYLYIAALRYSRYPHRPVSNTCHLALDGVLQCQDDEGAEAAMWDWHFNRYRGGPALNTNNYRLRRRQ